MQPTVQAKARDGGGPRRTASAVASSLHASLPATPPPTCKRRLGSRTVARAASPGTSAREEQSEQQRRHTDADLDGSARGELVLLRPTNRTDSDGFEHG